MNVKSKEIKENSTIELVIEVGADEFDAAVNKVYNKQKGRINVPGFRKGKAPRKIIEAMYGANIFYEDAIEEAYPDAYAKALEQEEIKPVAYPKLEIVEVGKEGFTFKALVTVKPQGKLGEYKGLTAEKAEVKVTDEDVEKELKVYIDRATRLVSVERPAQHGDVAVIDFEGFKDGVPFEGGKAEKYSLELGSGSFIPGFEAQVEGMSIGEEKDLNVTFPEEYNSPELAGADAVFHVKLHEVKEHQVPELDDEFAKDVSEFDTLAELRADCAKKVEERREAQAEEEFENAIGDQLIANFEVELPEAMLEYRTERMVEDYAARIQSQGIRFEDYLSMMGMTVSDVRQQLAPNAEKLIRTELALEAVAEAEKLEVTDEECEEEYKRLADDYRMELERVKDAVAEDIRHDLRMRKANRLVMDSAKVGTPKKTRKSAKKTDEASGEEEKKPARKRTKKAEAEESGE